VRTLGLDDDGLEVVLPQLHHRLPLLVHITDTSTRTEKWSG
jgi:hypothetical protein